MHRRQPPLGKASGWARLAPVLLIAAMLLAPLSGAAGAKAVSPKILPKVFAKWQYAKAASDNYKKWLAVKVRGAPK